MLFNSIVFAILLLVLLCLYWFENQHSVQSGAAMYKKVDGISGAMEELRLIVFTEDRFADTTRTAAVIYPNTQSDQ